MPYLEPRQTDSGMVCPVDGHLLILLAPQEVRCPDCLRVFFAVGHRDFDFGWACLESQP